MNEFRRMMQGVLKNKGAENWVSLSLVLLFAGLLLSRVLVSFASVLIVVPFLFQYRKADNIYWVAPAFIFLPVLISGLWSDDTMLWWNSLSIKIPLLTMMLGLATVQFSLQRWQQLVWILLLLVSLGCCWSLFQYSTEIRDAYLKAKTLPTPADNDHIRFSWLVVTTVILGLRCVLLEKKRPVRYILMVIIIFLVMYLHILAAKTGLVCLYAGGFIYLLHSIFIQKKWKTGLLILVTAFTTASVCYYTMPTLRNRIQYVVYDFSNYSKGNIMPEYGDASRLLSIQAGYKITNEYPFTGVGFGDILGEVDHWHKKNHPASLASERFLPANEWLVYGAGSGWLGLICFTIGIFLLLYKNTRNNALSLVLSLISLIPFLIDDTLEGQYGVVILAFIVFFGQQKLTEPAT